MLLLAFLTQRSIAQREALQQQKAQLKRLESQLSEIDYRTTRNWAKLDCKAHDWGVVMIQESFLGFQVRCLGLELKAGRVVVWFDAMNPFAIPIEEAKAALYYGTDIESLESDSRAYFQVPDLPAHTLTTLHVTLDLPSTQAVKGMYFIITSKGALPYLPFPDAPAAH